MKLDGLLKKALTQDANSIIKESMLYSALAPSKHLRAKLMEAVAHSPTPSIVKIAASLKGDG